MIRDAIQRELNRGGQVFFLHNRVMTIQTMAEKLQRAAARTPASSSATARCTATNSKR